MSLNYEKTKQFLRSLWNMEKVDRPAFRLAGFARKPYSRPAPPTSGGSPASGGIDPRFEAQFCYRMSEAGEVPSFDDDGFPFLNSYTHIGIHASAFGSPIVRDGEGEPKVLPAITCVEEFGKLHEPRENEETRVTLEYLQYLARHKPPGFLVTQADTQGPTDVASLVWDYTDMLVAALTDPEKVQWLLDRITDFTIDFARKQLAVVPDLNLNHNPGIYLPPGMGISASEDLLAVVSPEWYRGFGLPYNNRLSEAFGGIFVHSCGDFTQNLGVLREHRQLRGVNFNLHEVQVGPLLDALAGHTVLVPRLGLPGGEKKLREYVAHLDARGLDHNHHFYIVDNGGCTIDQAMALLRELRIVPK